MLRVNTHSIIFLRFFDTLSGEATLSKLIRFPFNKGSTLKGKNFLPLGTNSFLLERTFLEGTWWTEKETGSKRILSH